MTATHLSPPQTWTANALCTNPGADPDWWHPDASDVQTRRLAVAICHACPVVADCLAYALADEGELHGIWGGLTAAQRQTHARGGDPTPHSPTERCGSEPGYRRHRRHHEAACGPCKAARAMVEQIRVARRTSGAA